MAAIRLIDLRQGLPELVRTCRESLVVIARSRAFLATLSVVALVDGMLIGIALATLYADWRNIPFPAWFYLDTEFSFGEIWEYILTTAAAVGLLWRYRKLREPIIGCLGLVFVWLTIDNSMAIHEAIGRLLSPLFAFAKDSEPNPNDYGELVALCIIGSVILIELFLTGLRSKAESVFQSLAIVAMLAGTAFFAVFFDFIDHAIPGETPMLSDFLSIFEDGSEMVLLSIAAAIAMTARPPAPQD